MIKPRLANIAAAIALLLLSWGCSAEPSNQAIPGQQQIDKAKDAKKLIEKGGEDRQKQENEQEQKNQ